ncbi:hypothetical protein ECZU34_16850 [Escherichia coli]|nr:hypothetical protein ECZU17_03180 [Escherichia coli]GHL73937.1 hypothetical protein ECZU34_16850 [Escherichia coli]
MATTSFSGSHYLTGGFAQSGTLAEWQEQVAALCAGNSRLVFAVCCALAARCCA